jgi:RNA polymerase sigma factor (sigma-70 family)
MAASRQLLKGAGRQPADIAAAAPRRTSRWSNPHIRASTDNRLARRASNGDRRAIGTIFERYQQELYGFCLGLLGEPQDAQDALQNTMVKVLRALPGEEREIALRPWLYRIAHNEAVELRRVRHPTQALGEYLVDGQSSVAERAEQREQLEWLLRDLGDLPERQRTVLVMRELSGLDFAEIGAALDTSGAVVRQSLYEARRNLEQIQEGRNLTCEAVTRVLSDADGRTTRRRDIRSHLRGCPSCRHFQEAICRREGVLATIPPISLPVGAGAGIAQAVFGASGGGGTVPTLIASATKSAGTYGALKAAATVAAVAAIGATAMQSEMRPAPVNPGHHASIQARPRSQPSSPAHRVAAAHFPHVSGPSLQLAPVKAKPRPTSVPSQVADRQRRSTPGSPPGPALGATARLADLPEPTPATSPSAQGVESKPVSENATDPAAKKDSPGAEAGSPEQRQGQATKTESGKPEHPGHPSHSNSKKAETTSAVASPAESEIQSEEPKTPPGQARKQAREAEGPPPAPSPAVEPVPAAEVEPEAPQVAADPESNGKAKGHEK